ncbi:uncharacterized mitochondrial protein AtMg00860-like [Solanum lycopersicum]|uniref:uncharacterized mitochondrial protein AtMg00860-like n=1 Tax=Solanum lycopersicum TaxID=4081 RepID=UPI00374925C3
MEVDPRKTEVVKNLPKSLTPRDIRSFFELAGYYRGFVESFNSIEAPLTTLTKKKVKFIWVMDCEKSFLELKDRLTSGGKVIAYASRQLKVH